jgi:nucleotide-binding universal stress UspA family protein
MQTLQSPSTEPHRGIRASLTSPVIVATDGREQSDAALIAGRLFAADAGSVRVASVLAPMPVMTPDATPLNLPELDASRRADLKRSVQRQMARVWSGEGLVDAEVHEGDPATIIARLAHDSHASLIVAGLGRHRVIDRLFGNETALRLVRVSEAPVLAVTNGLTHAPRRIVVAIDYSETSRRAARLALELAAPGATIYLAHVAPRDGTLADWNGWGASYKQDAGDALQQLRDELEPPPGMILERVVLQGDAATELLAFSAGVNADLIATGSHGHGFVARMLIGSVTTRLLRCSTCSVLTVPHAVGQTSTLA